MRIDERINDLVAYYGGLRAAATALDIDVGYLSRLRSGKKTKPSGKILIKLGLKEEVTYVIST